MMKRITVAITAILALLCTSAMADSIKIDSKHFPDSQFRKLVKKYCDTDKDGILSETEAMVVTVINVHKRGIKSLEGIQYFPALNKLDCSTVVELEDLFDDNAAYLNEIVELDLSRNQALQELNCAGNLIKKLDLSNNSGLRVVDCSQNRGNNYSSGMSSIVLSNNPSLEELNCSGNALEVINLDGCQALRILNISDNPLTDLDLTHSTSLQTIDCSYCKITDMDVANCPDLQNLNIADNQIEWLDLSQNAMLEILDCSYNPISRINISNSEKLLSSVLSSGPHKIDEQLYGFGYYNDLHVAYTLITPVGCEVYNGNNLIFDGGVG